MVNRSLRMPGEIENDIGSEDGTKKRSPPYPVDISIPKPRAIVVVLHSYDLPYKIYVNVLGILNETHG